MSKAELTLAIIGMMLVTSIPRLLPFLFLGDKALPPLFAEWLKYVPACVLAALVVPDLLLRNGNFNLSGSNHALLAAVPTIGVAIWSRGIFLPILVGMIAICVCRFLC